MQTIMENWETYKPQETARETPPTENIEPQEGGETLANPRIRALMEECDAAECKLQEAILDLETREQSPAFQEAEKLYTQGRRLTGISNGEIEYLVEGLENDIFAGEDYYFEGTLAKIKNFEEGRDLFERYGISNRQDKQEILNYLRHLTEERTAKS